MDEEDEEDQDTTKSKVPGEQASKKSARASLDQPNRKASLDKTVTLTRQAADSNR